MRELALFAGAGGGILGGCLLGWRTVCAVESESYARDVLIARQDDGLLPPSPIWDDVRTFDGCQWRGRVDVVSGGFPCQDISVAGSGSGITGERSGLWAHMARIVRDVRPRFVFVENSPALVSRGLGRVLGDLAALGFDAEWCVLGADDAGAPHRRKRIWVLAHANGEAFESGRHSSGASPQHTKPGRRSGDGARELADDGSASELGDAERGRLDECRLRTWPAEPDVGRVAHGLAARVDRLRATGNGQVPRVAAAAFELLRARGGWGQIIDQPRGSIPAQQRQDQR